MTTVDLVSQTASAPTPPQSPSPDSPPSRELTGLQSALIGGLGGTMPIVAMLAAGEYANLEQLEGGFTVYMIGLGLRVFGLFALGAIWVWLHTDTRRRYPAFRLGMTAPAIVTTIVNASAMAGAGPAEAAQNVQLTAIDPAPAVVRTDADPPGLRLPEAWFADSKKDCTVLDGLLGRKCK
jgi:hypothetical protein